MVRRGYLQPGWLSTRHSRKGKARGKRQTSILILHRRDISTTHKVRLSIALETPPFPLSHSLFPSIPSAKMSDSVVVKTRKFMKNPLLSRRQVSYPEQGTNE